MDKKYDVIIIGAGIGGLTCGCYLAKAGMKVLIIEKHWQVGGYCTSFKRKGFTFDASVHYIGGGRPNGEIGRMRREFSLDKFLTLRRIDPRDNIAFPDFNILIRRQISATINELKIRFPFESINIDRFFEFLSSKDFFYLYGKLRKKTFSDLLNNFFNDYKLKAFFCVMLGNIGLSSHKVSALTSATLYREFVIDGGYYPKGGNQAFADSLLKIFRRYKGELILSQEVKKLYLKNKRNNVVVFGNNKEEKCRFIVSNIDATATFTNLLENRNTVIVKKLKGLKVSPSAFAVYLGLNINLKKILRNRCAVWKFSTYNVDNCYDNLEENLGKNKLKYIVCTFPSFHDKRLAPQGKDIVELFILAPFKTKEFWDKNKELLSNKMIKKAEELIPGLSNSIEVKEIATPYTFHKYTGNREGAIYGWASIPTQIDKNVVPNETELDGLYMAGHWATSGLGQGGITSVTYSGRYVAERILERVNKR